MCWYRSGGLPGWFGLTTTLLLGLFWRDGDSRCGVCSRNWSVDSPAPLERSSSWRSHCLWPRGLSRKGRSRRQRWGILVRVYETLALVGYRCGSSCGFGLLRVHGGGNFGCSVFMSVRIYSYTHLF
jgi:hypothetical protein